MVRTFRDGTLDCFIVVVPEVEVLEKPGQEASLEPTGRPRVRRSVAEIVGDFLRLLDAPDISSQSLAGDPPVMLRTQKAPHTQS